MSGTYVIFKKELADHLSSYRFIILFSLIAMVSLITVYMAGLNVRQELEGLHRILGIRDVPLLSGAICRVNRFSWDLEWPSCYCRL